ncbi:MAG: phosphodiester glycosidase family protein [Chitinophagaceae bacterium]
MRTYTFIFLFLLCIFILPSFKPLDDRFISYKLDPKKETIQLFWKDEIGDKINTLHNLNDYVSKRKQKLLFAMNCGMFTPEYSPVGLFIQNGKQISKLKICNTSKANFCLQPQGVFYITSANKAGIATAITFNASGVLFATQSAPVLLENGVINKNLPKGYQMNRNGAGIKKNGEVVLALGKDVNFHEFAKFFQTQGCTEAMFFDGGVSEVFYPAQKHLTHPAWSGSFGPMLGVIAK